MDLLECKGVVNNLSTILQKEIKIKNFFAGQGIFYQDYMFGLYSGNRLYIRAKNDLSKFLEKNNAKVWGSIESSKKLDIYNYYALPRHIFQDTELLKKIISKSISQIKNEKNLAELLNKKCIRKLPNLSIKYERNLAKVDICSVKQLQEIGAIDSYVKLRKNGHLFPISFFWALVAALQNKLVGTLTSKEKEHYLSLLNIALKKEGLRKVRNSGKLSQ